MKFIIFVIAFSLLILGGIVWFTTSSPENKQPLGEQVEIQGAEHIAEGKEHHAYNSNPPTSGWHYVNPTNWGVHDEVVKDEVAVHNLEHGGVWVTYHPDKIDNKTLDQLKTIVKPYRVKVLLSPRPTNDQTIAAVSWGRKIGLDGLDSNSEKQLENFIKINRNRGPEKTPF